MSTLVSFIAAIELALLRAHGRVRIAVSLRALAALVVVSLALSPRALFAQAELPGPDPHDPISVMAQHANHWVDGSYDVWLLSGGCQITQGALSARADQAVMWIDRDKKAATDPQKSIAYLEGNVLLEYKAAARAPAAPPASALAAASTPDVQFPSRLSDVRWFGRLYSYLPPSFRVPPPEPPPAVKPPVYLHALAARAAEGQSPGTIQQAQFVETIPAPAAIPVPLGNRRIRAFPRSDLPVQIRWVPSPNGNEWTAVVTSGVNLIIDGLQQFGSIDVSTDRLVLWTSGQQQPNLAGGHVQSEDTPLEIYMEGNVVFRQGDRIVQAQSMYFDVNQQIGVVLNAEVLTPLPASDKNPGMARIRANVLQQIGEDRFVGRDVSFTTSRLGDPSFETRAETGTYKDTQTPVVDPVTGQPVIDPKTGAPKVLHEERFTGTNNVVYAEGVPIFYWPYFSADLEKGSVLKEVEIKTDSVFGTQLLTTFDVYQIFGIQNPPKGSEWDVSLDYLSERGFGGGTEFHYNTDSFLGVPGKTQGMINAWFIDDHGIDDLGLDRRAITPESDFRGRLLAQHREQLPDGWQVTGEVGYQATRNFLEEYMQKEWDTYKDESTDLEIRKNSDNMSLTLTAAVRLNDFFTETDRLPQLDDFWIGQPLLQDTFTWYEHSSAAYLSQGHATTPSDPTDAAKFTLLPWETNVPGPTTSGTGYEGSRFVTRQEIDYPFQLGVVKFVPFALGEIAHWGDDLDHQDLNRAYGVAGLRASMPMWAVDPSVQLPLLNVNGIAHKIDFNTDFSVSGSSSNLNNLPLYEQLNDDSIQHFERRFEFNTFGPFGPLAIPTANLPLQFDPRYYALRRGSDEWVTGPTEIAGNQTVLRFDVDQRWQTKRGAPGDEHIIDWITFDTQAEIFPDAKQNYGSNLGQVTYDFHWFIGDRLSLVSSGAQDFFAGGERFYTFGAFLNRPPRGNFYIGYYSLEGPVQQETITTSYIYRMTPKWALTVSSSFNVVPNTDVGQSIVLTRIGESFLFSLGVNVDASRGTVGGTFMIEPRGFGQSSLSRRGLDVLPAGAAGLE